VCDRAPAESSVVLDWFCKVNVCTPFIVPDIDLQVRFPSFFLPMAALAELISFADEDAEGKWNAPIFQWTDLAIMLHIVGSVDLETNLYTSDKTNYVSQLYHTIDEINNWIFDCYETNVFRVCTWKRSTSWKE